MNSVRTEKYNRICMYAQLCVTLCHPMDCSPPGYSVYGIFQARILEWVAISCFREIFLTLGSNPLLLHLLYQQEDSPHNLLGFPGGSSGKVPACQCRRCKRLRFDPWVRKFPWIRKWQPTPVFLPGKSHRQRSLVGYSPWGHKRVRHDSVTKNNNNGKTNFSASCNLLTLVIVEWFLLGLKWNIF